MLHTKPFPLTFSHVVAGLVILSLLVSRWFLFPFESDDYTIYLKEWYAHLSQHGFNFTENFSNYNFPYLYLMWLCTVITPDGLVAIKIMSTIADGLLAFGAYKIINTIASKNWAFIAAIAVFMLPEVLLNSALWGQADSLYTAAIVWSVYFFMKNRNYLGWLLFFIAFGFKLQAIFILPALIIWFIIKKHTFQYLALGIAYFIVSYIPAWIAGRPFDQLFYAYSMQVGAGAGDVSLNVANLSVYFASFPVTPGWRNALMFFTAAVVGLAVIAFLNHRQKILLDPLGLLKMMTVFAFIMPLMLPNMLDRYFYVAGVLVTILAFSHYKYFVNIFLAQLVAVNSYAMFLLRDTPVAESLPLIPLHVTTTIQVVNVLLFIWFAYGSSLKLLWKENMKNVEGNAKV